MDGIQDPACLPVFMGISMSSLRMDVQISRTRYPDVAARSPSFPSALGSAVQRALPNAGISLASLRQRLGCSAVEITAHPSHSREANIAPTGILRPHPSLCMPPSKMSRAIALGLAWKTVVARKTPARYAGVHVALLCCIRKCFRRFPRRCMVDWQVIGHGQRPANPSASSSIAVSDKHGVLLLHESMRFCDQDAELQLSFRSCIHPLSCSGPPSWATSFWYSMPARNRHRK